MSGTVCQPDPFDESKFINPAIKREHNYLSCHSREACPRPDRGAGIHRGRGETHPLVPSQEGIGFRLSGRNDIAYLVAGLINRLSQKIL